MGIETDLAPTSRALVSSEGSFWRGSGLLLTSGSRLVGLLLQQSSVSKAVILNLPNASTL